MALPGWLAKTNAAEKAYLAGQTCESGICRAATGGLLKGHEYKDTGMGMACARCGCWKPMEQEGGRRRRARRTQRKRSVRKSRKAQRKNRRTGRR